MEAWEEAFLTYLTPYVTANKQQLINKVVTERTAYLTLALEHMIKPHNGNAALRTAECLGLQQAHIVTSRRYRTNLGVVKGASKWIDVHLHQAREKAEATEQAIKHLKDAGYALVVAEPEPPGYTPETLPLDRPICLWLGNEREGVSAEAVAAADYTLSIPMYGFTESLNVSVSAALIVYTLLNRLRTQHEIAWKLSEEEQERLKMQYYERIVRHAARVKPVLQKKYA